MELLIVIIILGLLASFVLPNLLDKGEKAKKDLVCVQMNVISEALDMFKLDNSSYPDTEEGLKALITNPDTQKYSNYDKNGYLKNGIIPKDSWKNDFVYTNEDGKFELISFGTDNSSDKSQTDKHIKFSECIKK